MGDQQIKNAVVFTMLRKKVIGGKKHQGQLPRPERLRRFEGGACVASNGSYRPGPTCVPMRSVGSGNLLGRDLGDFAAGHACSERSRRRSVLRGRLTAARPPRDTVLLPPAMSVSAPFAGLSGARHGLHAITGRAAITVAPTFATRSLRSCRDLRRHRRDRRGGSLPSCVSLHLYNPVGTI